MAEQVSNLILDGVEEIDLHNCNLTASEMNVISSQMSKLTKSVSNMFITDENEKASTDLK